MLPDFERADRIGEFWGYPESRGSPSFRSTAMRTGRSGRCSSGCCGRLSDSTRRTENRRRTASQWSSGGTASKSEIVIGKSVLLEPRHGGLPKGNRSAQNPGGGGPMRRHTARWVAWSVGVLSIALMVAALILFLVDRSRIEPTATSCRACRRWRPTPSTRYSASDGGNLAATKRLRSSGRGRFRC